MRARWHRHPIFVLGAFTLLLHQACLSVRPWRTQYRPWDAKVIARAERVRVEMVDKSVLELTHVTVEEGPQGTQLRGTLVDHRGHDLGTIVLPAVKVSQLDTRRIEGLRVLASIGAFVGIAIVKTVVLLLVTLVCIGNAQLCPDPFWLDPSEQPASLRQSRRPMGWLAPGPTWATR